MKKRKIVFVLLLALSLLRPYFNTVDASTELRKLNVNKTFFGDGVYAKRKGENCINVEKYHGIKHTVKDAFLEEEDNIEKHLREDILEINLDEISENSKITKKIEEKFGLDVVYASEDLTLIRNKSDSSGTAKIKLTVDYTVSTYRNQEYVNITKATGTVIACSGSTVRYGSGVSVVSNEYTVGQYGFTKTSGYQSFSKKGTAGCKPGSTWTYEPTGWKAVCSEHSSHMGANQTITLKRGESKWIFTLVNNYK